MSYRRIQTADDLWCSNSPHIHACFARNYKFDISQIISAGCDAVWLSATPRTTMCHIPKELNIKNSDSLGMRYSWKERTFSVIPQYSKPQRNMNAFKGIPVCDPRDRGLCHFLCRVENGIVC